MAFSLFQRKQTAPVPKSRKQQKKAQRKQWFLKILLIVVSSALLVYFMPRTNGFNYSYRLNQPWHYGPLYAAQKFNVEMSDSALQLKRDSINMAFMPYFNRNAQVSVLAKRSLMQMQVTLDGESAHKMSVQSDAQLELYARHIAALLDTVYSRGVVAPAIHDSLTNNATSYIRVIEGNVATQVQLERVFSTPSAYQFILEQNPEQYRPAILKRFNINTLLKENLSYDAPKSAAELEVLSADVETGVGVVMANEKIVDRGEIVTPEVFQKLRSYEALILRSNQSDKDFTLVMLGQVIMVLIIITTLVSYLTLFRRDYVERPRRAMLLFALLTLFTVLAYTMIDHHFFHIYALPCCMVPIIIRVFLDSRTAFVFHIGTIVLISLCLSNPYEFVILQIVTGLIAVQNLRELTQRSQIIRTTAIITIFYVGVYMAYEFIIGTAPADIDHTHLYYFLANGILLLFTYPLLWILEKSFGFVSDVTMVELSNINTPLLQRLTEEAPGTFQHSMQVANLASEVAKNVGAKVQLVRTAALYHDIGKLERPVFFTENQSGANPHKHLTPERSAQVIIGHVTSGLALADKHNLPSLIKRFITTHHGSGLVKYFYITYKNQHPDEEIDESVFRYPGTNPETIEEAILMMCDSVEAASRSLPEYTEESISQLVDRIIDAQVGDGFFTECDITFRDISIAKTVLKERLKNIYHTRIVYPEEIKA